jgi:hypothetical protein
MLTHHTTPDYGPLQELGSFAAERVFFTAGDFKQWQETLPAKAPEPHSLSTPALTGSTVSPPLDAAAIQQGFETELDFRQDPYRLLRGDLATLQATYLPYWVPAGSVVSDLTGCTA